MGETGDMTVCKVGEGGKGKGRYGKGVKTKEKEDKVKKRKGKNSVEGRKSIETCVQIS